ncbi:hypothetical protein U91I_02871 [alpha proteobacterium U9-1i]|nr:hypothetical protein U91I_02871 [alpha proteobacterium U9-1i]
MLELVLVAMFQAVAGAPAPALTDGATPAASAEQPAAAADPGNETAPAETAPAGTETTAITEAPVVQEAQNTPTQQPAAEERRERVCRDDASSGSRLRARRSCR